MKTALTQLIEEIDNQQKRYIDLAKKDKKLSEGVDAILTATTLLKMKAKELLEAEKEQIIEAYTKGVKDFVRWEPERHGNQPPTAEEYFNKTFKSDE